MALELTYWFLPVLLLAGSAVLRTWKWRTIWTRVVAATIAVGVAGWQTYMTFRSMRGRPWDPFLHGMKLAALALALIVDVAAAWYALRVRSTTTKTGGRKATDSVSDDYIGRRSVAACVFLLMLAAVLYPLLFPLLATTGE